MRWIEGYERLAEQAPNLPATRLVYVADREANMMPLMARAQQLDCPVDWQVRAGKNKTVSATCIVARKYGSPADAKPVEWRLLTNRIATDVAAVSELIDWFRARWEIEVLFNVLKNGCCVEELQMGTIERWCCKICLKTIWEGWPPQQKVTGNGCRSPVFGNICNRTGFGVSAPSLADTKFNSAKEVDHAQYGR